MIQQMDTLSLSGGIMKLTVAIVANTGLALGALFGVTACGSDSSSAPAGSGSGGGGTSSYVLGGTVSGLLGTGLTIRNDTTDLSISADGTFTFPTPIDSGVLYSITVSAQPGTPAQVCAVTNGNGTMNGAAVTDVTVTCKTTPLVLWDSTPTIAAIGAARTVAPILNFSTSLDATTATPSAVSLTGPTGSTVVTTSVTGRQLTVTPTTALLPLTTYVLTVDTSLRGSAGEQLDSPVTVSFTTADGRWQTAVATELNPGTHDDRPQVAFDAKGNGLAVWTQITDIVNGQPVSRVWANNYTANMGWGIAAPIETDTAGSSGEPQVAFDAQGNAIAVWVHEVAAQVRFNIWASRYTSANGWSTAAQIEATSPMEESDQPSLAIDKNGNALVVWVRADTLDPASRIWWNSCTAGGNWGTAAPLPASATTAVDSPVVAFDPNGTAILLWDQFSAPTGGGYANILSDRYSASSGWGVVTPVTTTTQVGVTNFGPHLAIDAGGNAMTAWMNTVAPSTQTQLMSSRYSAASGAWAPAVTITSQPAALTPSIVLDASGNALAVWEQPANESSVWSSRSPAGGVWEAPRELGLNNGLAATQPQLAIDKNGNALAVWAQQLPTNDAYVYASRYLPATGWGSAVNIGSFAIIVTQPQVAIDANGNGVAVWLQQLGGTDSTLWSNTFQ
jgi:hypothetical protein